MNDGAFGAVFASTTTLPSTMRTPSLATFAALLVALNTQAQDKPSVGEITRKIIEAVNHYTAAIACQREDVTAKDIASLAPYAVNDAFQPTGTYAVIWDGDIDCGGVAGSVTSNIAIVTISPATRQFHVVPALSSPQVGLDLPLAYRHRIVGNTADTLTLEGLFWDPSHDALCCPSARIQYTMKRDDRNNWAIVDKHDLGPKK